MARAFTILLSVFFLVEGVWGLFSPVVFGILTTNINHAIIHLVLGFIGLVVAAPRRAYKYCILVGILLLTVGLLYFVPGIDNWMVYILNVNRSVACVNVVIGSLGLIIGLTNRQVPVNTTS